jgi:hypothetical protein
MPCALPDFAADGTARKCKSVPSAWSDFLLSLVGCDGGRLGLDGCILQTEITFKERRDFSWFDKICLIPAQIPSEQPELAAGSPIALTTLKSPPNPASAGT